MKSKSSLMMMKNRSTLSRRSGILKDYCISLIIITTLLLYPTGAVGSGVPGKEPLLEAETVQGRSLSDFSGHSIGETSQILLVKNISPASADARILALEKKNSRWRPAFASMDGVIGRNGFALPGEKKEGDGRTPSGIFSLGIVFGYEPSFPARMPYRQATDDDLWVDDVLADDYNRWVTRGATKASSFERMKRDDDLYKLGVVVEYNTKPVIKGHGSAIFFHIWVGKGIPTAGCIALSENDLAVIVRWLDPAARPLVVMGTGATMGGY